MEGVLPLGEPGSATRLMAVWEWKFQTVLKMAEATVVSPVPRDFRRSLRQSVVAVVPGARRSRSGPQHTCGESTFI